MPDPSKYEPGFDYSDFEASNPTSPKPGPQLDNDFGNIAQASNEVVEAVKDIRRADGALNNGIVTWDSLSVEVKAVIAPYDDIEVVIDNIDDIVTVADNITDVNTVASNMTSLNWIADVYIGPRSTPPTTRADGTPLQEGDQYFDTNSDNLLTYNGSTWVSGLTGGQLAIPQSYVGNGVATTFTLPVSAINSAAVLVWRNGVRLVPDTQYTVVGATLTITPATANGVAIDTLSMPVVDASQLDALVDAAETAQEAAEAAQEAAETAAQDATRTIPPARLSAPSKRTSLSRSCRSRQSRI